jgi:predicted enzyme related to lactoylglutathione lyase
MSKQPEKVADFYAKIFGWKVQHHPEINYRVVETGSTMGINGVGWLSLFTDPERRLNGLWKPAAK